ERSCLAFGSALQRLELSEQLGDESFELRDAAFQGDTVGTSRLRHTGSLPKIALRSCASLKSALGWLNTLNNYAKLGSRCLAAFAQSSHCPCRPSNHYCIFGALRRYLPTRERNS